MNVTKFHEDERGTIWKINTEDGKSFSLIETKAGFMRSGDIHKVDQHDVILSGNVEIRERTDEGTPKENHIVFSMLSGDHYIVNANNPHTFRSITDSLVLEWWDGEFDCTYHKELRKIVEDNNRELLSKPKSL